MTKLSPKLIYWIIAGTTSLASMLAFTVTMIYQVTVVGLNPLQLVLLGTTLEATILLFEIPTGIVADMYSRRLSVIIGVFIVGVGMAMQAAPTFVLLLLAQVVWGIGYTFTSGATDAWLVDEIGEEKAANVFLYSNQVHQVLALVGIALSILIANFWIGLPIIVSGALFLMLGIFLIIMMPEHNFKPTPREGRNSWQMMVHTFRDGLKLTRGNPALMSLVGIDLVHGLFSEGYDRLGTAYILTTFALPTIFGFTSVIWFGLASAVSRLFSVAITEMIRKRFDLNQQTVVIRLSFVINVVLLLSLIAFPLVPTWWLAFIAVIVIGAMRHAFSPVFSSWMNQKIDESRVRATVLSMSSQMNAIGQIAGAPAIGAIGNSFSVRAALLISAVILSPVLPLIARAQGKPPLVIGDQLSVIEAEVS